MGVTLVDFLTRFYDFGIDNGYFEIEQINTPDINDGEGSCCPDVEIEVINFDKTKAKIEEIDLAAGKRFHARKSCDALKFMLVEGRLDFIEYKRWQSFIDAHLEPVVGKSNRKDLIVEKVKKNDFSSKIHDSITLLSYLATHKKFNMTNNEKSLFRQIPINFIVLVNINLYENPVNYILITLNLLAITSPKIEHEVAKEIKDALSKIPTRDWNIQKPMLKNCESIVTFYS